jgi:hypothetical protein
MIMDTEITEVSIEPSPIIGKKTQESSSGNYESYWQPNNKQRKEQI